MSVDFDWLEQCILGRSLSDHEKGLLGIMISEVRLKAGEAMSIEQVSDGILYLLRGGEGELILKWGDERMCIPGISEGARLGDLASLLDEAASATLIAHSDCVAYRIRRRAFDDLLVSRQPLACDMAYGVFSHAAGEIRAPHLRLADLSLRAWM